MKITIVGAGAIGRFFGGMLGRGGHEVVFVEKDPEIVKTVNEKGIQFMNLGTTNRDVYDTVQARATDEGSSLDSCDLIILAVKGYTTAAATRGIAHLVSPKSPVLSIQTGLGNIETIAKIVPKQEILGGVTFHGATSLHGSKVRHAGVGPTLIGELHGERTDRSERVKEAFEVAPPTPAS